MHQQDHLLLSQLRPTFPPGWMECETKRLEWVLYIGVQLSNSTLKIRHGPILAHKASANQWLSHH